jgi:hypothetical protein
VAGGLQDQVIDQTVRLVHFRAGSLSAYPLGGGRSSVGIWHTMTSHRILFVLIVLAAGPGCRSPDQDLHTPRNLQLSSLPSFDVGRAEGAPGHELYRVTGAVRLADGRVVVANSGTSQLRFFDSTGRYLSSAGRRGGGPGEFTGNLKLLPYQGDSLLVWDARLLRFSLFEASGKFVRTLAIPPGDTLTFPWDTWLYQHFWLEGVLPAYRETVARIVDSIHGPAAQQPTELMIGRFDGPLLWVARPTDRSQWTAHNYAGRPIGVARLPPGFEPYQFGPDFVLGRWVDEEDLEHVQKYDFTLSAAVDSQPSVLTHSFSTLASDNLTRELASPVGLEVLAMLSNLIGIQELYYADHGQYASVVDSLRSFRPSNAVLILLSGDRRGWAGAVVHTHYLMTCAIGIGASTPAGWLEGVPKCG